MLSVNLHVQYYVSIQVTPRYAQVVAVLANNKANTENLKKVFFKLFELYLIVLEAAGSYLKLLTMWWMKNGVHEHRYVNECKHDYQTIFHQYQLEELN